MVLNTTFEEFPALAERYAPGHPVFVTETDQGPCATVFNPDQQAMVRALGHDKGAVVFKLEQAGFEVLEGGWSNEVPKVGPTWLCAVAYRSSEKKPGLWVGMMEKPTTAEEVIKTMYEEFQASGDVEDLPLTEFMRLAEPNILVLDPEEQADLRHRSKDD
jgi:hypothetical protein